MRNLKLTLSALLVALASSSVQAKTVDSIQPDLSRIIFIQGAIGEGLREKTTDLLLLQKSDKPIWLIINSPGGYLHVTSEFMEAMEAAKEKGIKVKCLVTNLAASAGYFIYTKCSERYALKHSALMFHFVRNEMPGPVSQLDLLKLLAYHDKVNKYLLSLIKGINIPDKAIQILFWSELVWSAKEYVENFDKDTGYIVLTKKVLGLSEDLLNLGFQRMVSDKGAVQQKESLPELELIEIGGGL